MWLSVPARTQQKASIPVPGCASNGGVCVSVSGSRSRRESDLGQGHVMRNISVTRAIHNGHSSVAGDVKRDGVLTLSYIYAYWYLVQVCVVPLLC